MTEQVVVAFAGEGQGVGELTWAQKGLWKAMRTTGTSLPLGGVSPLPPGWSVEDVARAMRFALVRHPSLRTRIRPRGDGLPEQEVAGAGEAGLEVVDAGTEDPALVADRLRARWEDTVFDYEAEWPVRMAAVTAGGEVSHLVAVYCHLALDLFGLDLLIADLLTMDQHTGTSPVPADPGSPLALAGKQRQPAARRCSTASLKHWEHVLREIPARRLPGSADRRRPRFLELGYSSPAALPAVRRLAARTGLRTGPLLMAACAAALTKVTGQDPAVLQVLVNNRFRPGLSRSVTPLTQSSLCVVEVGADPLPEVALRAQWAVVRAGKNAYYDPVRLDELYAAVDTDRHEHVDVDCFFNDRRRAAGHDDLDGVPEPAEITAALDRAELRVDKVLERFDHRLFVHVNDVPDVVDWTVCADTHHLAPAAAEALLRQMEATLVEAALRG
jgi:hypothetical protein